MAKEKKTLKFQMMMAPGEAEVLDDWMFRNRVRSRAEAIRRLCQIGLAVSERMEGFDAIQENFEGATDRLMSFMTNIRKNNVTDTSPKDLINLITEYRKLTDVTRDSFIELFYISRIIEAATQSNDIDETLQDVTFMKGLIERSSTSSLEDFEAYVVALEVDDEKQKNDK